MLLAIFKLISQM